MVLRIATPYIAKELKITPILDKLLEYGTREAGYNM
jgi:hypothetical protein